MEGGLIILLVFLILAIILLVMFFNNPSFNNFNNNEGFGIEKINYFVNYYIDKNPTRQDEIDTCIINNIRNPYFNKIYIIGTQNDLEYLSEKISSDKITFIVYEERPTFNYFFNTINKYTDNDSINVMSNSDIYFDETLLYLNRYFSSYTNTDNEDLDIALALTRWDMLENGFSKFFNVPYSQDTWVFKGKIKMNDNTGNFYLGKMKCDNKIVQELRKNGYIVLNPSKTIKTYHYHLSGIRNYDPEEYLEDVVDKISWINPTF